MISGKSPSHTRDIHDHCSDGSERNYSIRKYTIDNNYMEAEEMNW